MQKFKKIAALALTGALAMTVMAGCGTKTEEGGTTGGETGKKEKLIMATSADYPPYEYHDTSSGTDKIVGFDIDIVNYIAKELNFEYEIKDMDFNGLLPALQSKRADFVMAGMTPKPERLANADFSIIYYEAKNTIIQKKGANLKKPEDLKGKKVGVQLGSIQEADAKNWEGIELKSLNKVNEMAQELKAGRLDAAIVEDVIAQGYAKNNPDLEFHVIESSEPAGSAVAFPKGNEKRVEDFNKVLQKMKDNGELEKLVVKWFGGEQ